MALQFPGQRCLPRARKAADDHQVRRGGVTCVLHRRVGGLFPILSVGLTSRPRSESVASQVEYCSRKTGVTRRLLIQLGIPPRAPLRFSRSLVAQLRTCANPSASQRRNRIERNRISFPFHPRASPFHRPKPCLARPVSRSYTSRHRKVVVRITPPS